MARQDIVLGTPPLGLGGDTPRAASMKINAMTQELYDSLPTNAAPLAVNKGGTGGKTAPEARASLGLVPAVSNVDITAGRLLVPGSGGVLGPPVAITNANGVTFLGGTRGIFTGSDDQAAAANFPTLGGGAVQRRWYIQTDLFDGGSSVQTAIETFGVSTTPGRKFTRTLQGGWRAWVEDVTLGNALLDPANGGLMSQTVVNGWLVQKFANGTMIMLGSPGNSPSVPVNTVLAGTFPIPSGFIGLQCFVTGQPAGNTDCYGVIYAYPGTNTVINYGVRNGATGAQVFLLRALIIGQWK